jgi:hypothetical protein
MDAYVDTNVSKAHTASIFKAVILHVAIIYFLYLGHVHCPAMCSLDIIVLPSELWVTQYLRESPERLLYHKEHGRLQKKWDCGRGSKKGEKETKLALLRITSQISSAVQLEIKWDMERDYDDGAERRQQNIVSDDGFLRLWFHPTYDEEKIEFCPNVYCCPYNQNPGMKTEIVHRQIRVASRNRHETSSSIKTKILCRGIY